mgnify:CR=1 FL=1
MSDQNQSSTTGLVAFAREIIRGAWEGDSFDGAEIQEMAEKHGLIVKEPGGFDPAKHKDRYGDAEPGDEWYALAGPLAGDFPQPLAHMEPDNG